MPEVSEIEKPLADFKPEHGFFVGIDSDGCAFDSMEIKHKECFAPNFVKYFGLQPVSKYARESFEFVNLYSKWRGINRWPAMIRSLDLTRERAEVVARKFSVPMLSEVRKFIESGLPLSNDGIKKYIAANDHPELRNALAWSEAVNRTVEDIVHGVPPYPYVRESLDKIKSIADILVVSATPGEALKREWHENNIAHYAKIIAGQEMGTKERHLSLAAKGKYPSEKILMVGDAPGDLKAARSIGALFFPINPGHEDASWQRFYTEAFSVFTSGKYAGDYEKKLITEFEALLPETPPWKKNEKK
jgi:phosphoglycolate phosphatase-like HAD superfamily hydrolase